MTRQDTTAAAEQSLHLYTQLTDPALPPEEAAENLIANLGRYCGDRRISFLTVIKRGIARWHAARDHPSNFTPLPHVTINIQ